MKNIKKIVFGISVFFILNSCESLSGVMKKENNVGKAQVSIENTKWILAEKVKGNTPTLFIETNKINGNSGCNQYFGTLNVVLENGSFSANQMGSTKMSCPNDSVEKNFLEMLQKVNKYVVTDSHLLLYKDELLLLKFDKAE